MTTYYRRKSLTWWEEMTALGLGALSGAAAYYLLRTWLRREQMENRPGDRRPAGSAAGGRAAPAPPESSPPRPDDGKEG